MDWPEMDDGFGHWLAGFVDGEGSFGIYHGSNGAWRCTFKVSLRSDDLPILEEAQMRTGLGDLYMDKKGTKAQAEGRHPCAAWTITRKREVLSLVSLFERYPLRAKKGRDFAIWAQAVRDWSRSTSSRAFDWSRVEVLAKQLRAQRAFDEGEMETEDAMLAPVLTLFEESA